MSRVGVVVVETGSRTFNCANGGLTGKRWINIFEVIQWCCHLDIDAGVVLKLMLRHLGAEVNISSYPGTLVPGLFFHSRAVIFKSGCFVQKYWSGTVTRKTVIQRADDY